MARAKDYAIFQDLSSDEPAHRAGVFDALLQTEIQTPKINGASLERNESALSRSYALEAMMRIHF